MILGFALLFSVYFISMIFLVYGFRLMALFSSKNEKPRNRFSVIIPFRNEAENLRELLKSISNLSYPSALFEIIFVNDASEDISEEIILSAIEKSSFSIKLIQNKRISNSPKKDAITEAIQISNYEWIATTDADCKLPKNWLKIFDAFIQQNNPVLVAGPVVYNSNGSFIENFQQLDGISLQAATIGSFGLKNPLLSNGANLFYKKEAFLKVNGFSGNNHLASGDDIFMLEKMKQAFPQQVKFLKSRDAIVSTTCQNTWKNVINQRIRWASKTSKQKNIASVLLGILVFVVNLSLLTFPFLIYYKPTNWKFYAALFILKIIADYFTLKISADFFRKKLPLGNFLNNSITYGIITTIVVLGSIKGSYVWKGRKFEKTA